MLSAFVRLVSHTPELQAYTVQKLYSALQKDVSQEALTLAGLWTIGEYGDVLLSASSYEDDDEVKQVTEKDIVDLLESINVSPYANTVIRQYVLVSAAKLSIRFGKAFNESQDKLRALITSYETSPELELQQRSIEFTQLLDMPDLVDGVLERMPPPEIRAPVLGGTASEAKPVGSTQSATKDSSLVDIVGEESPSVGTAPAAGNAHDLLADIFGTGGSNSPSMTAGGATEKSSVNDIMGLYGQGAPAADDSVKEHKTYTAYDANGLLIILAPTPDETKPNIVNIRATFTATGLVECENVSFQAAVPKSMKLQMQPISNSTVGPGGEETQLLRVMAQPLQHIRLRLRISFVVSGRQVQNQVDFSEFPNDILK